MIRAIIIDDELHCLQTMNILINDFCPDITVVDRCTSGEKALESIENLKPDLIFLDIEMPSMNGFELLEHFDQIPFSLIFTTSYDQYAIRAIRFSALDYLLKPVNSRELIAAVHKVRIQKNPPSVEQFHMLLDQMQHRDSSFIKIAVPTAEGYELIPTNELVNFEASNNYTLIYLKNRTRITACRTLKEMEEQLNSFGNFIRVHHSHIVNLNEVSKYIRGEGGYLVMSDGSTITVSKSRKEKLLRKFQPGKIQ
jgi:two-component system LytT family response regulator